MAVTFTKATKKRSKARFAIDGASGSGKTYTALTAATALAEGGRIAVIDTERGSASLYSDIFDFDVLELNTFSPTVYVDAIKAAEEAGYDVIVIDSLSHAWEGEGGALDLADAATKRQRTPNSYTAWRDVTPIHRAMVDAILQSKCHIVATMRSKMDYVQEKDERTGKTVIRKVGMAPIQRQGMEYEFTVVADMDLDNNLMISKTRFSPWNGVVQNKPDVKFFKTFVAWLNDGDVQKPMLSEKPTGSKPKPVAQVVNEITTTDGTPYEQLTNEQLVYRMNTMAKMLKDNGLTPEARKEYQDKIAAGQKILAERNGK